MGFISEYKKAKEKAEQDFARKHPIINALANNKQQAPKKKTDDLKNRMRLYDLSDEERRAVLEEGYEPEDFEDDELEDDDYYFDEKDN